MRLIQSCNSGNEADTKLQLQCLLVQKVQLWATLLLTVVKNTHAVTTLECCVDCSVQCRSKRLGTGLAVGVVMPHPLSN